MARKKYELKRSDLAWKCSKDTFPHKTTEEIESTLNIVGQERAVRAITLGLGIDHDGYNIFVTGLSGTGRMTTIRSMVSTIASKEPNPGDWVYVFNFEDQDQPLALHLDQGKGKRLQDEMSSLIRSLRSALPSLFTSEPYQQAKARLAERYRKMEKDAVTEYEKRISEKGFSLVQIQMGPVSKPDLLPVIDGKPVPAGELDDLLKQGAITREKMEELQKEYSELIEEMGGVYQHIKTIQAEFQDKLIKLQQNFVLPTIKELLSEMRAVFEGERVSKYLNDVQEDILSNLDLFVEEEKEKEKELINSIKDPFLRYRVNVVVDNSKSRGRPIVMETHPSYQNLFGTIERVALGKNQYHTDFTHISAGSLLQANGGYLVLNFMDLISEPGGVWTTLMRMLRHATLTISPVDTFSLINPIAMKPEPIPLKVKVILIGEKWAYTMAYQWDEDFKKIFKILAEFDREMTMNSENTAGFIHLMRKIIDEEELLHFSQSGVFALMEYASREAGRRDRLSTRFDHLADIMREANYWARQSRSKNITDRHVRQAVSSRDDRHRHVEDKIHENFMDEILMVSVTGKATGQINGLTVYDLGYHRFGAPAKLTAQVSLGQEGIVNIERESDMAGNVFTKGTMIITGYLRGVFTRHKPLSMHASLCFEQSYGGIDGDSASMAETCVLLSAIADIPLRQDLAITGSMNQMGVAQPIGGVNEKIEGFFRVCKQKGLSGTQGVIIPESNVRDLVLSQEVLESLDEGTFHIYAVDHVTQAAEILTGMRVGTPDRDGRYPRSTLYARVNDALQKMAREYKDFK
ncbi:MAG TPA: ATP-binding protein [Thermoanaerobaculia bacterium]|nr:ATP-binding protein [Thermoanaerobaculia bacterium]HUM29892.1 ATP-binding protein [Thermoanaerobaculia bacterium]HXK68241.1 ATP-binding protein [Thermoanaerobaculia bacterium]